MAKDKEKQEEKATTSKSKKAKLIGMVALGLATSTLKVGDGNASKNFKTVDRDVPQTTLHMSTMPSDTLKKSVDPQTFVLNPDTIKVKDNPIQETQSPEVRDDQKPPEIIEIGGHTVEEIPDDRDDEPIDFDELNETVVDLEQELSEDFISQYDIYKEKMQNGASKEELKDDRHELVGSALQLENVKMIKKVVPVVEAAMETGKSLENLASTIEKHGIDSKEYKDAIGAIKDNIPSMKKEARVLAQKNEKDVKRMQELQLVLKEISNNLGSEKITKYLEDTYGDAKKALKPVYREKEETLKQENRSYEQELKAKGLWDKDDRKDNKAAEKAMKQEHDKDSRVTVKDIFNKKNSRDS